MKAVKKAVVLAAMTACCAGGFLLGQRKGVCPRPSSDPVEQRAKLSEFREWLNDNVRVVGPLVVTNGVQLTGVRIIQIVHSPPIMTVFGTNVVVSENSIYRNEREGSVMEIGSVDARIMNNVIR